MDLLCRLVNMGANMNIGIDIDGVILDSESVFRTFAEIYDIENFNKGVVNKDFFKVQDRFAWNEDIINEFMKAYGYNAERYAPLFPGVKEVLQRLKEMGHNLIVITARGLINKYEEQLAFERLEEEKLPLDKIIVHALDKLPVCKKNNIDIMIDDSPHNVKVLSDNGIKCLYMRGINSWDVGSDNVIDVYNWGEILRYFVDNKHNGDK